MPEEEAAAFITEMERYPILRKEFEVYQRIWSDYQSLPLMKADREGVDRFDRWLSQQNVDSRAEPSIKKPRIDYWKYGVAASMVLLIGWFFAGRLDSTQVESQKLQNDMMQLIAAESTTERIKGVNNSLDIHEPDAEVVDALLKLLANDESDNVRLRIVEALQQYELDDKIKDALIFALEKEKQPIVQIAIINALVGMGENKAKHSLENLIQDEDIQPFVKDEARLGLTRL